MRTAVDILNDAIMIAGVIGEGELQAELESLLAREFPQDGMERGNLPIYLVTLSQDVGAGTAIATRKIAAVLILRPDDEHETASGDPSFLLPRDTGDRVFGNWKVTEVERCESYEIEIPTTA